MSDAGVCRYVEAFDQETMVEMTRVVSAEGAALVEAQTSALFGDLKQLQRQMQVPCAHLMSVVVTTEANLLFLCSADASV